MGYIYTLEADLLVPDLDEAIDTFGRNLGIWPRADWPLLEFPEEGLKAAFCPVGDLAEAPTYFSLLEPTDPSQWVGRAWQEQSPRPHRYHCFGVMVDNLDILIKHFDRFGITYLLSENVGQLKGRRLFVGRSQADLLSYDPSFDHSARLEFLSVKEHPWAALPSAGPSPSYRPPGAFVRVESKSIFVEDIYKAIRQLGRNFFLWPAPGNVVQDIPEEGIKSVLIHVGRPEGAKLELISPYDFGKPMGKYFKQYGEGHYHIRLVVNDLDARLRQLEKQGVAFDVREAGPALKYRRAWIDPSHALGANLELVDYRT
jgi:hypothetical protein